MDARTHLAERLHLLPKLGEIFLDDPVAIEELGLRHQDGLRLRHCGKVVGKQVEDEASTFCSSRAAARETYSSPRYASCAGLPVLNRCRETRIWQNNATTPQSPCGYQVALITAARTHFIDRVPQLLNLAPGVEVLSDGVTASRQRARSLQLRLIIAPGWQLAASKPWSAAQH